MTPKGVHVWVLLWNMSAYEIALVAELSDFLVLKDHTQKSASASDAF